ncbi:MAG: insulinase family protein [Marinilabiliales bacterium]|nr:insulinase family protein [Marinilabiliales bacterium]
MKGMVIFVEFFGRRKYRTEPASHISMIHFEKNRLKNGLIVLVHQDRTTPFVAVNVCYKVGSKHEDPARTGFAHLFEHLTFGGTVHVSDFDTAVQMAGGSNNAFTTSDITNYHITLPAKNIETALWLESDRMIGPDFTAKGLAVQKKVVIEEFRQRNLNKPYGDVWHLLRDLSYKVHSYRWPTIGLVPDHIRKASLKEVKDFFYHHYAPNNAILVLSGDIDPAGGLRLAEKWFGDIPSREIASRQPETEPVQTEARTLTVTRKVPVDTFYVAWPMAARSEKAFYALDLLSDILSNGSSSRFETRLVKEEKIFTEADAFLTGENEPGLFVATGKAAPGVDIQEAMNRMLKELFLTTREKISAYELEKVQNRVESDLLINEIGYLEKAVQLASFEVLGDASLINRQAEMYRSITPADLQEVAELTLRAEKQNTLLYLSHKKSKK